MDKSLIDRQKTFSGTRDVSDAFKFDEARLESYLKSEIPGFFGPIKLSQFKGGQSNPTYKIEAGSGAYVLRRKPPGKLLPSAHAVDREFRVISALNQTDFPVPKAHILCEDDDIIGTAFYVMDFVEGRVIWDAHVPGVDKAERREIFHELNKTMARLHTTDIDAVGLSDFGRPANYVARQVARWSKQYKASETIEVTEMEQLIAWLPENLPEEGPAALIHGDFRLDNAILAADRPEILAVLDWELSTLGDPIADFTYHLMQWIMPESETGVGPGSLVDLDLDGLGIPGIDDYVAEYCDATGRSGIPDIDTYFAYNLFRLAAILQGIVGRARDGTAASAVAEQMGARVQPLAALAWQYAIRAGAK